MILAGFFTSRKRTRSVAAVISVGDWRYSGIYRTPGMSRRKSCPWPASFRHETSTTRGARRLSSAASQFSESPSETGDSTASKDNKLASMSAVSTTTGKRSIVSYSANRCYSLHPRCCATNTSDLFKRANVSDASTAAALPCATTTMDRMTSSINGGRIVETDNFNNIYLFIFAHQVTVLYIYIYIYI